MGREGGLVEGEKEGGREGQKEGREGECRGHEDEGLPIVNYSVYNIYWPQCLVNETVVFGQIGRALFHL